MIADNTRSAAWAVNDRTQHMDNMLRDEVYGGRWNDEVGHSYLSYTENLRRLSEKLIAAAESMCGIENSLAAIDESAAADRLEKFKAMVSTL